MKLTIPELSFVVLVGVSGSGKSTFARRHFKPTEVLSSDYCRGLVSDDENSQAATNDAFEVLHFIARKRLGKALDGGDGSLQFVGGVGHKITVRFFHLAQARDVGHHQHGGNPPCSVTNGRAMDLDLHLVAPKA